MIKKNDEINYEMLSELKYMDMVINETLRKFPAATRTDRICNQDYEYEGMKIPKGSIWTVVSIILNLMVYLKKISCNF